jgi:hypothetical protein
MSDNRTITSGQTYVAHIQRTVTVDDQYFVGAQANRKYLCYVCEQR